LYIKAHSIDDLMHRTLGKLLGKSEQLTASRGEIRELAGVLLCLTNPRARLSRTNIRSQIFGCLGEFLWYLSGSDSVPFITYYLSKYADESEDGNSIKGAYGPRLMGSSVWPSQLTNTIQLLKKKGNSKRAVMQIFSAHDLTEARLEVPCTCSIQLILRKGQLHMLTSMRSNDAFKGLPHDIFAFTMIQELIARALDVKLGSYKHFVGSMHLYSADIDRANAYMDEGWQESSEMPSMPPGDPFTPLRDLIAAEATIRNGFPFDAQSMPTSSYWGDLTRLLLVFRHSKNHDVRKTSYHIRRLTSPYYMPYVARRVNIAKRSQATPIQPELGLNAPAHPS
jgi:thymidylate synthase